MGADIDRERLLREGMRRLEQMLPAARAKAAEGGKIKNESELLRAQLPFIREENFLAVVVYPAPKGGWHADLVLKNVPPGYPDRVGTPVQAPCRSKIEAHEFAQGLLASALILAARNADGGGDGAPSKLVFLLDEWAIDLEPQVFERLSALRHLGGLEGYGAKQAAHERVASMVAQYFPEGVSRRALEDLPHDDYARVAAVLHMAALNGVYAYPPRLDAAPDMLMDAT